LTIKLNELQRKAVVNFDTNLLVMAGAGTGKTRVLTHKYMYLLKTKKCEVPQIVAVTFTKKAADEMRARIREEIKTEYRKSIGKEKEFWARQMEMLEVSSRISTIHGLCFSILTQHPVEAGIDPEADVLDEGEEYLLKAEAAKAALSALLSEDQEKVALQTVLTLGSHFFLEDLTSLYSTLKDTGKDIAEVEDLTEKNCSDDEEEPGVIKCRLFRQVEEVLDQAHGLKLTPRAERLLLGLSSRWTDLKLIINSSEQGLDEKVLYALEDLLSFLPKNLNNQLKPGIYNIHDTICSLKTSLATQEAALQRPVIYHFLQLFAREYTKIKRVTGKIDFTDQQFLVRRLLTKHPEIVEEYRKKFYYFMVDEFQDTNSLQWDIILLLSGDKEGRLFLVGDIKQSIYRFRGAEVEIMTRLAESYSSNYGELLVLDQNYRTKPQVAEVINYICQSVFATEDYPYHPLIPAMSLSTSSEETGVEIILAEENEPAVLAARIRNIVEQSEVVVRGSEGNRPVEFRDIAILLRARTNIKSYEEAFANYGIPYIVNAGTGFYSRQEIQDQINLLRLAESTDDSLALAGVLRSPFCSLSDAALFWLSQPDGLGKGFFIEEGPSDYPPYISTFEKSRIIRLRRLLDSFSKNAHLLSIPALLRIAWEETGYLETIAALPGGDRSIANLEKFMLRAEEFAAKGYSGVGEFVSFLRHLSDLEVREGEASATHQGNAIQIMTIHAAKGLEFPVVILPEMERRFNFRSSPVGFHKNLGLAHKVKDKDGGWVDTYQTLKTKTAIERAEISELKRLFYVAMTRAKDYLLFSGEEKQFKTTGIDEGNSWMEWLIQIFPSLSEKKEENIVVEGRQIKITRGKEETSLIYKIKPLQKAKEKAEEEIAITSDLPLEMKKIAAKRLSLTPLLTFMECPRRFYWEHRLGSDPNLVELNDTGEDSFENYGELLGEVFHRLISDPSQGENWEEAIWAGWFEKFPKNVQVKALMQLKAMRKNYLQSPFFPGEKVKVDNEFPFLLDLKGVVIKGVIDRVLFYPDGSFVVVDFKTNRNVPKPGKILDRYLIQVHLYSLALREIYGRLPAKAWLYFVRPDVKIPCSLEEKRLYETESKILKAVEYIASHDLPGDYPQGEDCTFCPFTYWCTELLSSS
jgi:ATP-dependent exoDNAse (exonuclease V) beta subunit